jgi:hypothetical protein
VRRSGGPVGELHDREYKQACSAGSCNDPAFPYCDVEGTISGEPGTCIAVSCTPGNIETCLGDVALTCNTTGDGYDHVPCELGCESATSPHCAYIEPRYVPDACDTRADTDLVINSAGSFDPNLDSNCNGGLIEQSGGPSICVVHHKTITIEAAGVLRVLGTVPKGTSRPVALVADERFAIEGTLDLAARGFMNGPGGGITTSGGPIGITSTTVHVGGGGSGGKTAGAAGASATVDGGAANGGLQMADPALLSALIGGAAAGGPMDPTTGGYGGGGGGGAATLISCFGELTINGTVNAGGGGGSGGQVGIGIPAPGFGGGAGGYVVLQGRRIAVTGGVFANGGGGGAGASSTPAPGLPGKDAYASSSQEAQGGQPDADAGRGGAGGVGTRVPTIGLKPTATVGRGGGGGGSVGFLQTYTPEGIEPTLTPSAVSPAFQPNATIKTR